MKKEEKIFVFLIYIPFYNFFYSAAVFDLN